MKLPVPAPQLADLAGQGQLSLERLLDLGIGPEVEGVYAHWDHLRNLTPPEGLTPEAGWAAIKQSRIGLERELTLHDKHGHPYAVSITESGGERCGVSGGRYEGSWGGGATIK